MPTSTRTKLQALFPEVPWITADGYLDPAKLPIDSVLQQAMSPDGQKFQSGCNMLCSMLHAGRTEAGVFLLGLMRLHPDDPARLMAIVKALRWFQVPATVEMLASELRRVKGSSATRAYLRSVIDALASFPAGLAEDTILSLSTDSRVGPRFREHLQSLL